MDKRIILPLAAMFLIIISICSCKTQKSVADNHYQDTVKMSKDECQFLNKGSEQLKEMKQLAKRWMKE